MDLKLAVNSKNPPIEVLIAAEIIESQNKNHVTITWHKEWKKQENACLYGKDDELLATRNNDINRYFARTVDHTLYGGFLPLEKTEVDHWMSFSIGQLAAHPLKESALEYLDCVLLTKTWLVNKRITLADIHVFCALLNRKFLETFGEKYSNITRWYKHILSHDAVKKTLSVIAKNSPPRRNVQVEKTNEQTNTRKQEGKFIDLPGAEMGKVIVRFPPEASGYLHIGHAKAALLNQYYAEAFQGQLIMRFDDTNPAKETVEFEEAILEDLKLLQIKPDRFTHTSDYFDVLQEYCTILIKNGRAFVDDTSAQLMKEQRDQKLKSENRDNSIEKNLMLWDEMRRDTKKGQECCVRAKIDYESANGCLRDPTIYRCKSEPHPRTGDKYKVYPTYDFACPIVDSIENVTHTLRTTEYRDRDPQFFWILEALGLRMPHIWEYSRLNMTHTVLSKRKLTWFVNEGLVDGWDDPRFPTVRGILRRGMTVEGLKQFIIAQGSSRSVVFMQWDKIWAFNKKVIDPVVIRYTALDYGKTVSVDVEDAKEEWLTVQNHPKDQSKGTKQVRAGPKILIERDDAESLIEGQNATFINWGNLMIKKIERKNGIVVNVKALLNLEDKNYKNTLKITWLSAPLTESNQNVEQTNAITCYTVYFDHIMSVPVLGKDDDFKDFVAKDTRKEVQMLGEVELKGVKKGEIIQLQRKGFFICDVPYAPMSPYSSRTQPVVLFHIPDGHMAMPSKNTVVNVAATTPVSVLNTSHGIKNEAQDTHDINEKIVAQGDKVRCLKAKKADKASIDAEVKVLLALKAEYKANTGGDWKPGNAPKTSMQPQTKQTGNNDVAELQKVSTQKLGKIKTDNKEIGSAEKIANAIQEQGDKVRNLKSIIDQEVKILLCLKNDYKNATGQDWKPTVTEKKNKEEQSSKSRKIPEKKVARDTDTAINTITDTKASNKEIKNAEEMAEAIQKQGDKVRSLKCSKTDKSIIDQEVKILLSLKSDYKNTTGQDWKPATTEATSKKKKEEQAPKFRKTPEKEVAKGVAAKDADTSKTGTRLGLEAKKEENFFDWYSQIITKSGMIEYYDVSGCYILRPWSFAIWKTIKEYIDKEITALGVQECYFPIFVTRNVLEKEKAHIADFAPEVAWVTKCGDSDLAEPIAIRPTSETVMYPAYAKWLRSDTELPLKLNQWNNVVRWEFKDPKPFLRTREFLWQEGHTAFATKAEADEEVLIILDMYSRVYEDLLAVPVVKGRKTEKEKFAGGDYTTTVESFISTSGRAIQGATSHHLGQNFSRMFNIQVEGAVEGDKSFVYQNSWGLTTRTIGVMIMVHGDDKGLVLPPNVAFIQAVVVPCGITANTKTQQRELLQSECDKLIKELSKGGKFKIKGDFRNNRTPGWKFSHWELKGVPVRIELGPKDLEKDQVTFVRRDNFQRLTAKRNEVTTALASLLNDIQSSLLNKARANLNAHIKQVECWDNFISELNKKNLLLSPFCGNSTCEDNIKTDSTRENSDEEPGASMGAKSLCIPFEQPKLTKPLSELRCIHPSCSDTPKFYALFGRSY